MNILPRPAKNFFIITFFTTIVACGINTARKNYILAEKLWNDGKYAAAVVEYEKVTTGDLNGKLGQQALFRAAITQLFFLSQYDEAARKLRQYLNIISIDSAQAWEAEKLIGEILYSKSEQYDQAIHHYSSLIKKNPKAPDVQEFIFRIAKSHFYLGQFNEAISAFSSLVNTNQESVWRERAAYEIGVSYYTKGNRGSESYQDAIDTFEIFLKKYPKSRFVPEAKFGIANCLEEMDQLNAAYHAYETLRSDYIVPRIIEIKLARIRERKIQRSR
ncbi:MAG: tetratricopeptide repeat protein [Candidatus Poribacteria bacterium]